MLWPIPMKNPADSITTLLLAAVIVSTPALHAEQTGTARRVLAADDTTGHLGIVAPDGKLEWETKVGAIHDAQVLPNGNILFQQGWTHIVEMDHDKKTVWEYDASKMNGNDGRKVEVHSFQRFEDGTTLISESGPGRLIVVDGEGKLQREIKLKVTHPSSHSETRLARRIANGNYLVAQESDGFVREYDPSGTIVWEFEEPLFGHERKEGHGPEAFGNSVFSAVRLATGNTLIGGGNGHCVLEVNPAGEIVWKISQNDLPGVTLAWVTRVERLPDGNTLIGNCHAGPDQPQFIEVTPDKKVVWTFKDFTNFGNSTTVQMVLK
ncbi:MAG: PQQ-binding-like beta-propeller repeat protein [Luteolibacter sp.]|uniref:beta-propeller domain-containing protein n=1 Tax=Luteolibacter sp. TaxID=1962973 RepID=UPI00326533A5